MTYTEDATYQVNYTYNNIGALDVVTYPTSTSGYRLALKHNYSYGFLQQVQDNASSATYWTLNSANDYSSPVTEILGNAVTTTSGYEPLTNEMTSRKVGSGGSTNNLQDLTYRWDDNGNMDRRQDFAQSLTETLTYDELNRLKTAQVTGGTLLTVDYDAAGNIKNKSDVSATDYNYSTNQTGCTYTGLPAQPHAVRNAGGVVYCYDANGNMIKRGGSTITWYSYNQPNSIASGSNSTQFNYNANHQRWRQVAVDAGATTTTYYIGGIMEKVVRPGAVTEYRHLIPTGSGTAIYTRRSTAIDNTYYLTTDHLGSADLVLSSSGTVMARESFSPFGERRGSNWQGLPSAGDKTVFSDVTRRGFTGHEMLDAVGLVHMNGRVYDPRIGRFLSADPIIQTIAISQALNPYSYVMNNPLTLIDPSGYSWLSSIFKSIGRFLKKWGATIVGIAFAVLGHPYIAAFLSSAIGTAVNGGDFGSFALGLAVGFAAGAIAGPLGSRLGSAVGVTGQGLGARVLTSALTGGLAGGISSAAMGGSFLSGFAGGALGGALSAAAAYGYEKRISVGVRGDTQNGDANADGKTFAESKVVVTESENSVEIRISMTYDNDFSISTADADQYAQALEAWWSTTQEYDGKTYTSRVTLTRLPAWRALLGQRGDLRITGLVSSSYIGGAHGQANPSTGVIFRTGTETISTPAHEFGHILGLGDRGYAMPPSIMNYPSTTRDVTGFDLSRLRDLYGN